MISTLLPHAAPGITLSNVSLRFHDQWLFKQFTLALPAGQTTCLLGASGVGKTTLLRLLAGLPLWNYTATESGASLGEVATTDNQSLSGRIAYMAQTDLLMPWLTVRDNVLIGYRLRGERVTTQVVKRAMMLIEQVGLATVYMKKPTVLSGGMRQRVALARTLMENKPVVLMDEPFSALDAVTRFEIQTLAAQCLQGRTVLLVTHDPWEALRLADQILVLRGQPATLSIPLLPPQPIPRDLTDSALFDLQKTVLRELHMTGVVS